MKDELIEKMLSDAEKDLLAAKDYLQKLQGYLDNPKELERSNYCKWEVEDRIEGAAEDVEELTQMIDLLKELKAYKDIGPVKEFERFKKKEKDVVPTDVCKISEVKINTLNRGGTCPTCNRYVNSKHNWDRCYCGQRLDWSTCD